MMNLEYFCFKNLNEINAIKYNIGKNEKEKKNHRIIYIQ